MVLANWQVAAEAVGGGGAAAAAAGGAAAVGHASPAKRASFAAAVVECQPLMLLP